MKVSFCSKFQRVVWVAHLELLASSSHQGEMAQNILEGCVISEVRVQTGAPSPSIPPASIRKMSRKCYPSAQPHFSSPLSLLWPLHLLSSSYINSSHLNISPPSIISDLICPCPLL